MKIVLDANIIVSAYVASGPARDFWADVTARYTVVISPEILIESEKAIRSQVFGYCDAEIIGILQEVLSQVSLVRIFSTYEGSLSDPDDIHIAALSVQEKPAAIVTGDKALRAEQTIHGIPILTMREFSILYGKPASEENGIGQP